MAVLSTSKWPQLPRTLLISSAMFLEGKEIIAAVSVVCRSWKAISEDEHLFRMLLAREYSETLRKSIAFQTITNMRGVYKFTIQICPAFDQSDILPTVLWYRAFDKDKAKEIRQGSLDVRIRKIKGLVESMQQRLQNANEETSQIDLKESSEKDEVLFKAESLAKLLADIRVLDEVIRKRKESMKIVEAAPSVPTSAKGGKKRRSCTML